MDDRTRWEDTGLTPGTEYSYEVRAVIDGVERQSTTCVGTTLDRALTCSVGVAGEEVTVSFNGDDFSRITIRRDGSWQGTVDDRNTFVQTLGAGNYSYEATGVVNGFRSVADCGTATVAARGAVCSVSVADDRVTVSFNGGDFSRTTIRRDGAWLTTLRDETTFAETLAPGTYSYTMTGVSNGFDNTADCGTATVSAEVLVCTVTVQGDDVLVSWNDVGASTYQARSNGGWAATLDAGTTSWTDADGAGKTHQIRYRANGERITVDCA